MSRERRWKSLAIEALFRFKKFLNFDIIIFLFLFDKHCPIMK